MILDNINRHYDFRNVIGSGHFGIVREARKKGNSTNLLYAVKSISKANIKTNLDSLRQELAILRTVDHPNIIKLYETYEDSKYLHMVTELCTGGDLFDNIAKKTKYTELKAAKLMHKMLGAVNYLHINNIVHRDLKPENFLFVTAHPTSEIKVIDFGLSM
jgi:calcium-dependent protein kinase